MQFGIKFIGNKLMKEIVEMLNGDVIWCCYLSLPVQLNKKIIKGRSKILLQRKETKTVVAARLVCNVVRSIV